MHPYFPFPTNTLFILFPQNKRSTQNPNLLFQLLYAFVDVGLVMFGSPKPSRPRGQWCSSPNWPTAGLTRRDPAGARGQREKKHGEMKWRIWHQGHQGHRISQHVIHSVQIHWFLYVSFKPFLYSGCLQMLTALCSNHKSLVASYFACTAQASLPVATESWQDVGSTWIYVGSTLHWLGV